MLQKLRAKRETKGGCLIYFLPLGRHMEPLYFNSAICNAIAILSIRDRMNKHERPCGSQMFMALATKRCRTNGVTAGVQGDLRGLVFYWAPDYSRGRRGRFSCSWSPWSWRCDEYANGNAGGQRGLRA